MTNPFHRAAQEQINELSRYVLDDNTCLTTIQVQIMQSRLNGMTYRGIVQTYGLSCQNVVTTCLKRTALGRKWFPGNTGGNDSYLGEVDQILFIQKIKSEADSINCVPTCVAVAFAHMLNEKRAKQAQLLLTGIGCPGIAANITCFDPPHESWLRGYCLQSEIRIVRPQELELIRRTSCDVGSIYRFFEQFYDLIDRDRRLIFNMDETMVSAKRKYKVLVQKGRLPLTTSAQTAPHLTGCITVSASGTCLEPLLILKSKKTLAGLEDFQQSCIFCSSNSGWMNRRVFIIWVMVFITQVAQYRTRLPKNIRSETILLITDGHGSRRCFTACFLLWCFDIELLILPGHCSHVMQPFDVALASPLKSNYKKALDSKKFHGDGEIATQTAQEVRTMMISSFLDAVSSSCTYTNVLASFASTGLSPLDPSLPLNSQFAMLDVNATTNSGAEILNDLEGLNKLFKEENGRDLTDNDLRLTLNELKNVYAKVKDKTKNGLLLSDLPSFIMDTESGEQLVSWT